ncbi:MAG: MEDS domain-containing protein [Planctomycetota bacterium]
MVSIADDSSFLPGCDTQKSNTQKSNKEEPVSIRIRPKTRRTTKPMELHSEYLQHALRSIEALGAGDHLCFIFGTDEEHSDVITPFLLTGLERGDKIIYMGDAKATEVILRYLHIKGVNPVPYLDRGQLVILPTKETYLKSGAFDPEKISEQKKAQQYLDIAASIILALDTRGEIMLLNHEGSVILECDREEVIGKNWFDTFLPEAVRPQVKEIFAGLISGSVEAMEYWENQVITGRGNEKRIRWHNRFIRDETGTITGTISSGEDITEIRKTEERQKRLEAQIRHVQKLESLGILAGGIENHRKQLQI